MTLARQLGVSRTTVSNAFSRPDQLSADLRDRILSAAAEVGFSGPSLAAASLRTGKTRTLGVLFTDSLTYAFSDPVSARFLAGIAAEAELAGYAITIVSAPRSGPPSPIAQAVMDGVIIYSVDDNSPALKIARERDMPRVLVDQRPESGADCVNVADRAGAEAAAKHLIGLGHQRLAVVTVAAGPGESAIVEDSALSSSFVARERLAGWRQAVESAGFAAPVTVSCPVNGREHGRRAAGLLLALPLPPSAIACLSDEIALGIVETLQSAGVIVPTDISVIGFDDAPQARPFLTTIQQPYQDKGALAARLLMEQIERPERSRSPSHEVLPVRLIVRESTGPARR
ncbi:LacI family DNA-binding transcriptional regulator [Kribbella catacumbae]|uniref:LacI family DNA-binding transcriptional regulator n=1 Tax=Kribbella catacumbae TaxID=460086 RepID=UPI000375D204|nr:LacI family DNA-binding transcriptional regulator [Kribbella catacumbae]